MLSILSNKFVNINQQNFKSAPKETNSIVIQAIDTIDLYADKKESQTDAANNALIFFPAVFLTIPISFMTNVIAGKKKLAGLAAAGTVAAAGLFGNFAKKRAIDSYNAHLSGQNEGIKRYLDNPKLFVPLDKDKQNLLENSPFYKAYINKQYKNDVQLFPDFFSMKESKKFLNTLKQEVRGSKFISNPLDNDIDREISDTINQIDSDSQKYMSKVLNGLNILYTGLSLLSLGAVYGISKLAAKKPVFRKTLGGVSAILLYTSACVIGKLSNTNFFDHLEQVSRFKAKKGFNNELQKKDIATCVDYLKRKGTYISDVQKHNDLVLIKNEAINSMDFSEEELKNAEQYRDSFVKQVNSEKRMKKIKQDKLFTSFSRDFLLNSIVIILSLSLVKTLLDNTFSNGEITKSRKNSSKAGILLLSVTLANLLAGKIYSNKQDR